MYTNEKYTNNLYTCAKIYVSTHFPYQSLYTESRARNSHAALANRPIHYENVPRKINRTQPSAYRARSAPSESDQRNGSCQKALGQSSKRSRERERVRSIGFSLGRPTRLSLSPSAFPSVEAGRKSIFAAGSGSPPPGARALYIHLPSRIRLLSLSLLFREGVGKAAAARGLSLR